MDTVELTVVYDNYPAQEGLQTAHGFACVVREGRRTVLFDTGGSGQILLENMAGLGIAVAEVEAVVVSHMHWDHIGGLDAVLAANPKVTVYVPMAFSSSFRRDVKRRARAVVETKVAQPVTNRVWTTDAFERPLVEQALYVETAEGIVVVTGCAHPGVVELTRSAQCASGKPVHAVLGGFHMAGMSQTETGQVVDGLRDLRVRRVGPSHCSGDIARDAMREEFGDSYLDVGVGARLTFPMAGSE
jgi:7,8-dihydropterin-6-yl-methyl-4-(beta-D-ribofuranosyl)aminobenzene 5'-phosphate synthase